MKAFFIKTKNWIVNHFPSRRRIIQLYTFLLYNAYSKGYIKGDIYKGVTKNVCVPGMNCYSCPGAIAACPLGALQNALYSSGTTTAYFMFGMIGLYGLIFARTICGFLCPVGMGQELLFKVRTPKIGKSKYTRILSYLKYVLLVALVVAIPIAYSYASVATPGFCKYICPAGTFEGGLGLLLNPSNWDSTLRTIGPIFTWKFIVLIAIITLSVFMYRPFCRFLCPLGAIYGFFNSFALLGVKLDKNKCTDCGLCVAHCKMDVKHVGDHECINCGECIKVCPAKALSWKGSKLFLRENDYTSPIDSVEKPLSTIKNIEPSSPSQVVTNIELSSPASTSAAPKGLMFSPALGSFGELNSHIVMVSNSGVSEVGSHEGSDAGLGESSDEYNENASENSSEGMDGNSEQPNSDKQGSSETPTKENSENNSVENNSVERSSAEQGSNEIQANNIENKTSGNTGKSAVKSTRPRSFWVRLSATIAACLVLIGALVYYNAFYVAPESSDLNVGDPLPDFTLTSFEVNDKGKEITSFTPSEHLGQVIVLNFWATWCGPCVNEMPEFAKIANEYPDVLVVAIHGHISGTQPKNFFAGPKGKPWRDYNILFVQGELNEDMSRCLTFELLGGRNNGYPMTIIVDKEGKVTFMYTNSMTYEKLKAEVEKAVNS